MRVKILGCVALFALGSALAGQAVAQNYMVPAGTAAYIRAAVESDERTEEMSVRDAARKPAEILTLSGVKPGDRVIEMAGFGLYYTTMLSAIVGEGGSVSMYDLPYIGARQGAASAAFVAAHANTEYHLANYNNVLYPSDVDVVFNVLYYHDLGLQDVDRAAMNRRLYASLKSGGRYVIVDHKAEDGSAWRDTESLHRVGVETIIEEVTAAGFRLTVNSDLLANPDDDRKAMVFAPGTRGATDRAVFVFTKP